MTFKIITNQGVQEVAGNKFLYRFKETDAGRWFFYCEDARTVSDLRSGMQVCKIDTLTVNACLGNYKNAAILAVDDLVERIGEERFNAVLNGAPAIQVRGN